MSQILIELLGTFSRAVVVFLAGTLVSHSVWTEDQAARFTDYLVPILTSAFLAVALALYRRYRSRVAVQTALDLPRGATPDDLKAALKSGRASSVFKSPIVMLALAAALGLSSACALSTKAKVVTGYEATQTALEALQDAELAAYQSGTVAALTPAVHARAQRALVAAFDAQIAFGPVLQAWRAGDAVPQGYTAWLAAVNGVVDAIEPILPQSPGVWQQARAWARTALAVATMLGQTAPLRLQQLAAAP